ncbi:hypothetical protein N7492_008589 [Penicillium capsulatum]|uniref:Uncharacterized protein n=1 Tax=Penicillium capsulatum TaxID=69766 RepID=A0A9W9LG27_9EURO|nr:hypothetical protein N7492_008589 [Penicillium capsulatum]KAJ6105994.1 hypothetical protein N7512_009511 [Penicillium capsulatum]
MSDQNANTSCQGTTTPLGKDEYMIQPFDKQRTEQCETLLLSVVSQDDVYASTSKRFGVLYWTVFLTPEQAKQLEHPTVIITKLDSHCTGADGVEWDPFGD